MTARLTLLLALILWPALAPAQPRPGAPQRPVILVLDASGSMWKRVFERGPRRGEIAAAFSDAFTMTLREQDRRNGPTSTAALGLVRFGYQFAARDPSRTPEEKCNDIEHIVPGRIDDRQVEGVARASGAGSAMDEQGWNPKGMTPVTQAMLRAARDAPPGGADLVVVTDIVAGESICPPDPCPDGVINPVFQDRDGDFVKKGIRVKFFIASGLEAADDARAKQLSECFKAGFFNPQSITVARNIGIQVAQAVLPVQPSLDIDVRLAPSAGRPLTLPRGFRMADLGLTLETLFRGDRGPSFKLDEDRVTVRAPAGTYDGHVYSDIDPSRRKADTEIKKNLPVPIPSPRGMALTIEVPPATLVASALDAAGDLIQKPIEWTVALVPPASAATAAQSRVVPVTTTGARLELDLPPGHYVVNATLDGQRQRRDVNLWFGAINDQTKFVFKTEARTGTFVLQVRNAAGALHTRSPSPVVFGLAPLNPAGPEISAEGGTQQRVPEGSYRVTPRLVQGGPARPFDFPALDTEVVANQSTEVVANLPTTVLHVEVTNNGVPFIRENTRFEVVEMQPNQTEGPKTTYRGPRLLQVGDPGRYRIKVMTDIGEQTILINLSDGERGIKSVDFPRMLP